MVHPKKKSGDPDYDDKVPLESQIGKVVTAGDGRQVLLTESTGPVDAVTGEHVNLDDPTGESQDNRPEPGGQATEPSTVQTYTAEDTALASQDLGKVDSLADAQDKAPAAEPEPREEATVDTPKKATSRKSQS